MRNLVAGLIIVQIILFGLSDSPFIILISSIILLFLFILLFNIWLYYVNPQSTIPENTRFLIYLIKDSFVAGKTFLIVKNGKTDQEYFLLKKKPVINYLYIYDGSAAITTNTNGQLNILDAGLHRLERKERVYTTLDLSMQHFPLGPDPFENPFDLMKSGESYTDFHARQLRAQKGKAITKDNRIVYASFNVYYQFSPAPSKSNPASKTSLLSLGQFLYNEKLEGEASPHIQDWIEKAIAAHWESLVQEQNLKSLFMENSEANLSEIMNKLNNLFLSNESDQTRSSVHVENTTNLTLPLFKLYLKKIWVQPGIIKREMSNQ